MCVYMYMERKMAAWTTAIEGKLYGGNLLERVWL